MPERLQTILPVIFAGFDQVDDQLFAGLIRQTIRRKSRIQTAGRQRFHERHGALRVNTRLGPDDLRGVDRYGCETGMTWPA